MERAVCWLMTSLTAGAILPERDAVGVGDFADEARGDADAVVGEDGVGVDLFLQGDFRRAKGDGQVGGNVGCDAEAVRHVDDLVDADARGQLDGGNVARLGEGVDEGHRALEVVLVIVRRVAAKADRRVDDDVVGLGALFHGRGVDVGLEAGADLSFGLGGAVELGERVVAAADHGEHVAGGVVHGEERALRAGILLQGGAAGAAFDGIGEMNIDDVAGLDECVAVALAGPLPVCGKQDDLACADAGANFKRQTRVTTAWT